MQEEFFFTETLMINVKKRSKRCTTNVIIFQISSNTQNFPHINFLHLSLYVSYISRDDNGIWKNIGQWPESSADVALRLRAQPRLFFWKESA